mmetsp:Transcript_3569/g.8517  ORF Transcript_3569/g.8517 Transcript_3569/m.8517 type:complete len:551 (+) Transcript_3569:111-1763(+)
MVVGATRQSRFLFYVWQILLTAALQGPIKPDPGSQLGGDPWPEWSRSAESLASSEIEQECRQSVDSFLRRAESSLQSPLGSRHPNPRDMLFFLHVPRTAGRTFFACFLKQATPPSKRCAKSYDILRLNVSVEGCGLLSSHDDYSVTAVLPPTATVITQIRDPVDRVLSAYEFAVEVASRHLQVPLGVRTPRPPGKPRVDTRNVWPWSLLVPWMEADMRMRAAKLRSTRDGALKENNTSRREFVRLRGHAGGWAYYHSLASGASKEELSQGDVLLPNLDPYNNPLAMPLREFIEHPIVASTIHNGAALQVLGLTNYSHHRDAAKLRGCVAEVPSVREAMVRVAVQRLQGMYHVGVTDRLQESITSAAGSLGINLTGPAWRGKADAAFEYGDESVAEAEAPTRSDGPYSQLMHLQNQTDAILKELSRKQKELEQLRQSSYNSGSANAALDSHAHTLEREVGRLRSEAANLQMLSMRSRTTPPKVKTQPRGAERATATGHPPPSPSFWGGRQAGSQALPVRGSGTEPFAAPLMSPKKGGMGAFRLTDLLGGGG